MARYGGLVDQSKRRNVHELITPHQVLLACKHLSEMVKSGVREDLAGRTLDLFVDIFAKLYHNGSSSTHTPQQIHRDNWSDAAKALVGADGSRQCGDIQVEHGTPRRRLSELILQTYERGELTPETLVKIVEERWVLAVVTRDEHQRLKNDDLPESAKARWAAAGITFS